MGTFFDGISQTVKYRPFLLSTVLSTNATYSPLRLMYVFQNSQSITVDSLPELEQAGLIVQDRVGVQWGVNRKQTSSDCSTKLCSKCSEILQQPSKSRINTWFHVQISCSHLICAAVIIPFVQHCALITGTSPSRSSTLTHCCPDNMQGVKT